MDGWWRSAGRRDAYRSHHALDGRNGAFLTGFGVIQAPAVDGIGVVTATGGVLGGHGAFNTNLGALP